MASSQARTAYKREVAYFDKFKQALATRDPNQIAQIIRGANATYKPLMERIAQDYMSWGALTPETQQFVSSYTQGANVPKDKQHREMIGYGIDNVVKMTKQFAQTMPTLTAGQAGQAPTLTLGLRPGDVGSEDFTRYMVMNKALQYMDPTTQRETQLYMARENPFLFGGFSMYGDQSATPPAGPPISPVDRAAQLQQAAAGLDWNALYQSLPEVTRTDLGAAASGQSAAKWLQEYLQTAAKGMGGTRAEQQFARRHLATMEEEAAAQPALTNWVTLAQNLVSPVQQSGWLEGQLGQSRTVQPPPGAEFKRKGIYRNIALT